MQHRADLKTETLYVNKIKRDRKKNKKKTVFKQVQYHFFFLNHPAIHNQITVKSHRRKALKQSRECLEEADCMKQGLQSLQNRNRKSCKSVFIILNFYKV